MDSDDIPMVTRAVKLSRSDDQRLKALARLGGGSISDVMRSAVRNEFVRRAKDIAWMQQLDSDYRP